MTTLADKRHILQLETLYDLSVALRAQRPEPELVEELLQHVCAALDPRAACAVTRGADGEIRALANVGWPHDADLERVVRRSPAWVDVERVEGLIERSDGDFLGRDHRQLLLTRLGDSGEALGLLGVLDKETRGGEEPTFTAADRRFLESVAALAGVALENVRRLERLEVQRERLEEENRALKGELVSEVAGRRIIAGAPAMREALERAERVAPRGVSVLVRGESGTGKELIARLLHVKSGRTGALIAINCAALPEGLLESELFGIEGGVATGVKARSGRFELAHEGTLFLDEIGDLAPALQVKLLRAIQEKEIVRIGGHQSVPVDVRVVAATHRDLEDLVEKGTFREDLYYRLRGIEIELPPLRDRREDVPLLVRHFAREFCSREGLEEPHVGRDAMTLLLAYDYPGNVRELQNVVEAAISLAEDEIDADVLRSLMAAGGSDRAGTPLALGDVEHRHIARVLRLTGGNKSAAAKLLGIDRRTLQRKGF